MNSFLKKYAVMLFVILITMLALGCGSSEQKATLGNSKETTQKAENQKNKEPEQRVGEFEVVPLRYESNAVGSLVIDILFNNNTDKDVEAVQYGVRIFADNKLVCEFDTSYDNQMKLEYQDYKYGKILRGHSQRYNLFAYLPRGTIQKMAIQNAIKSASTVSVQIPAIAVRCLDTSVRHYRNTKQSVFTFAKTKADMFGTAFENKVAPRDVTKPEFFKHFYVYGSSYCRGFAGSLLPAPIRRNVNAQGYVVSNPNHYLGVVYQGTAKVYAKPSRDSNVIATLKTGEVAESDSFESMTIKGSPRLKEGRVFGYRDGYKKKSVKISKGGYVVKKYSYISSTMMRAEVELTNGQTVTVDVNSNDWEWTYYDDWHKVFLNDGRIGYVTTKTFVVPS